MAIQLHLPPFASLSLSLSAYAESSVPSLDILCDRMQCLGTLSEGY